jgi:hypothetical protein
VSVRAFRRTALPLASYYFVTLARPLANGAAASGAAFARHALFVLMVPLILVMLGGAIHVRTEHIRSARADLAPAHRQRAGRIGRPAMRSNVGAEARSTTAPSG